MERLLLARCQPALQVVEARHAVEVECVGEAVLAHLPGRRQRRHDVELLVELRQRLVDVLVGER